MKTVENRRKLYKELLADSTELPQFLILPSLLSVWPEFKDVRLGPYAMLTPVLVPYFEHMIITDELFCSSLWLALIDRLLDVVNSKQAAENVVAICLSEQLSTGVVQVRLTHIQTNLSSNP